MTFEAYLLQAISIASKLEIIDKGLSIKLEDGSRIKITEFYVTQRWNYTAVNLYPTIEKILRLIFPENGCVDCKLHFYNFERLSYNLSFSDIVVKDKPYNYSIFKDLRRGLLNRKDFVYFAKDYYYGTWGEEQ